MKKFQSSFYFYCILIFTMFPLFVRSADIIKPDHGRDKRQLGDIFLGVRIGGGITNMFHHTSYESVDTKIIEKNMYFYNLSFTGEFYLESYVALVLDYGLHSLRFDRQSNWSSASGNISNSQKFFEQWFNRLTISTRFLFANIFYLQIGPSILINYNSSGLENFSGIPPIVNDTAGVSLSWQVGLGASYIAGYQDNGDPLMTIDAGFYTYIPVVGNIIENKTSINAGGTPIRVKANPYQFEWSLAFTFLV